MSELDEQRQDRVARDQDLHHGLPLETMAARSGHDLDFSHVPHQPGPSDPVRVDGMGA